MARILLLDDEEPVIRSLLRMLRPALDASIVIEGFTDPTTALARAKDVLFDAVVSDYRMPYMNGLTWLRRLKEMQPDTTRLILSASSDFHVVQAAINEGGVDRFLSKPWDDSSLPKILREAVALTQARREQRQLADERRHELGTISDQEAELRRLELLDPGITRVNWGPDGEVYLDGDVDGEGTG